MTTSTGWARMTAERSATRVTGDGTMERWMVKLALLTAPLIYAGGPAAAWSVEADRDGNGYVDKVDLADWMPCLGGPGASPDAACLALGDFDANKKVDLADFAYFARQLGHLPVPLRNKLGDVIGIASTQPYSPRQTCAGSCHIHDIDHIANGFKFQQGRTDTAGNIVMQDDFFQDGRWWQQSPGRFGTCSPAGGYRIYAGKNNDNESEMEVTAFSWVGDCGACHPGGGPGEFDRDGMRLFDDASGEFGYEALGLSAEDVALDGDYAYMDASGNVSPARWDLTGVSEPDCLYCHTADPSWAEGPNADRYTRRVAAFAAKTDLVDGEGAPVPAFLAAGVAAQGWFSSMPIVGGKATELQIDYAVGVQAGAIQQLGDETVALSELSIAYPPRDLACWQCHGPIGWERLRGGVWFEPRDFHYAKLNNLLDDDPQNDIPPAKSKSCAFCHPGNLEHNIAKGNSFAQHSREDLDWVGLRTCRSCHMEDSSARHPDAPPVPGTLAVHLLGRMMDVLSCQACHITTSWATAAELRAFRDKTVDGGSITYNADAFYSADPVNPDDPDKSTWYPGLYPKVDEDGMVRLFPAVPNLQAYWGDWDQRGTPEDRTDDVIRPIISWRLQDVLHGQPLAGVTDDNGDGRLEVNRPEEILAYIQALRGNDHYGRQVSANPVLVRGWGVWYEDAAAEGGVNSFDPRDFGIKTDVDAAIWGMNHNVRLAGEAWGHDDADGLPGCRDCHRPDTLDSPVMDRVLLADPFGPDGLPVYTTIREMTGLNPP